MISKPQARHEWLDVVRGLAMAWIFLVHVVEKVYGCPYFANPSAGWPPWSDRIAQLRPLAIPGIGAVILNGLRYVGWLGDMGVQIFVVASGFGLTWSAMGTPAFSARAFYQRRLFRILPIWWSAHLLFVVLSLGIEGIRVTDWRTWASLAGLRFLPSVMYFFSPAWWFCGLLVQLYFVFPLLERWLRVWSLTRFCAVVVGGSLVLRLVGLLATAWLAPDLLDWWSRGGLFLSRLPEFGIGMAFAALVYRSPGIAAQWFGGVRAQVGAFMALVFGIALSFSLVGNAVAMALTGAAFVVLVYALAPSGRGVWKPVAWFGKHSMGFFLVHHTVVMQMGPTNPHKLGMMFVRMGAAFLIALGLGELLSWATDRIVRRCEGWYRATGLGGMCLRGAAWGCAFACLPLAAELWIRRLDPQEVLGWGERPSLRVHERYGYHLTPNQVTRLRWLSYDYTVTANDLGFPGPHYPYEQARDAVRILVTGDAYESAEGVDTDGSWPRLLERELTDRGLANRVSNFSITGWGPNQYAAVVQDFVASHQPHVVVVGLFVNDFEDVMTTNAEFQASIGFGQRSADQLLSVLQMAHLKAYSRAQIEQFRARLKGTLSTQDSFFGHFGVLERASLPVLQRGVGRLRERLMEIQTAAATVDAKVVVVEVPAPAQVCSPDQVDWFPRGVRLTSDLYDRDQPQRLMENVCKALALTCIDLRPPLREAAASGPCQRRNLHFTQVGHQVVARFLASEFLARRLVPSAGTAYAPH